MQSHPGSRVAKEFLVSCIADEAKREGTPLSSTERDMLFFSETAWTLPNMDTISETFDREYDQSSYEAKISALIRNFKARAAKVDPAALETWNNSVRALQPEDHYILVMIQIADGSLRSLSTQTDRPKRMLNLIAVAVAAGIGALLLTFAILFAVRR